MRCWWWLGWFETLAKGLWIQTDEDEDVAASVRHALRTSSFVNDDSQAWKWVALSLHSALQGACICHLVTTASPVGAVTKKNAGEWLAYFEDTRTNPEAKSPKTHLMSLPDLLKAIRKPDSSGDGSNTPGVVLSDSELAWLKRFHDDVRNQFTHFEPMGWSIEVSGIPGLAKLVARLIEDIANAGWAFRHKDAAWKSSLGGMLKSLSDIQLNA